MTATTLPVLDSAQWMVEEFQAEILGEMDPLDEDYDKLIAMAVRYVSWALALYWFNQGKLVKLVSSKEYGRLTGTDEALWETASSYELPGPDDALALWESIAASITPDEIRQFADLS